MRTAYDDHSLSPSERIRRWLTHWLSFFATESKSTLPSKEAPIVVLTDKKHQLAGVERTDSDSDCACE